MYKLNTIKFENFGLSPGRINASNIALSGMLDMPPRLGKTFHDWTGEAGIEPYVLPSEIRHGGRTLNFSGYFTGANKASVYGMMETFFRELASYKDLVALETPWGTHQVYIKENVAGNYLQHGWVKIELKFEEPVVTNEAVLPTGTETEKPNIDGVAFDDLGMFLTGFKNHLNRPKTKAQHFTAYETQGYQITPPEALEFELELTATAGSFTLLKQNIQRLQKLFSSPGMRELKVDDRLREVFNTKGFSVSQIKVADAAAICKIRLPLMTTHTSTPLQITALGDGGNNNIADFDSKLIHIST